MNQNNILNKEIFKTRLPKIVIMTFFLFVISSLLPTPIAHASMVNTSSSLNSGTLSKGLVGWWTMDGKNLINNVTDSSGSGNTGYLIGTTTSGTNIATSTWVTNGKLGQGLNFDGRTSNVFLGNRSTLGSGTALTISAWVKTTNTGAEYIFGKSTGATTLSSEFYLNSSGKLNFGCVVTSGGGADSTITSNATVDRTGKWVHLAVSYGNSNASLYINGVLDKSAASCSSIRTATLSIQLGNKYPYFSGYWKGSLDDVRIYSRALSASEVKQLYNMGAAKINQSISGIDSGLMGWWTFDGKNLISNVADSSGQGKNGTMFNMATSTAVTAGKIGQGIKFDGSNDYITTTAITFAGEFTTSFWIKLPSNSTAVQMFLGGGDNSIKFGKGILSNRFFVRVVNGGSSDNTIPLPSLNKWHHIILKRDSANKVDLIVDNGTPNRLFSNVASSGNYVFSNIGRSDAVGGQYWRGTLDDIRVYNRNLSAGEIKQLYNLGSAKVNQSVPSIDDGLVGWWTFDGKNMISNVADSSGSGNTGNLQGFTSTSTAVVAGKIGQGLKFDGVNDYVNAGNATSLRITGPITMSGWVKGTFSASNVNSVITKWDANDSNHSAFYMVVYQKKLRCVVAQDALNYKASDSTITLSNNVWYHITVVWAGSNNDCLLYLNGVATGYTQSNIGTVNSILDTSARNVIIGMRYSNSTTINNSPFLGQMDDVRVYSRALSASEVKQLYNLGR